MLDPRTIPAAVRTPFAGASVSGRHGFVYPSLQAPSCVHAPPALCLLLLPCRSMVSVSLQAA